MIRESRCGAWSRFGIELPEGDPASRAIWAQIRLTGTEWPVYNAYQVAWVHFTLPCWGRTFDACPTGMTILTFGYGLIDIRYPSNLISRRSGVGAPGFFMSSELGWFR